MKGLVVNSNKKFVLKKNLIRPVVQHNAKGLGITLHYLLLYSRNLNPIQRRWKVINEKVRNNRYFATVKNSGEL